MPCTGVENCFCEYSRTRRNHRPFNAKPFKMFETLGRNKFPTQLRAWKFFLLNKQHADVVVSQMDCCTTSSWPGSCDDHVVGIIHWIWSQLICYAALSAGPLPAAESSCRSSLRWAVALTTNL